MDLLEILSFSTALIIGIILGLIGGGGSILTVPVFVYLFHLNPVIATAYSLFVVGVSALVGAIRNIQKGYVDFKTAIVFAIPAFIAVYTARKYILPNIPDTLFTINDFEFTKEIVIMVLFAIIMLLASFSMIRNGSSKTPDNTSSTTEYYITKIIIDGVVVGLLTGIVGAGGGFLIIPALVLFAKLPMKKAVATSLFIIAIKSLIGFIGDIETISIDWNFLLLFTSLSIIGIFIGVWLNKFIDGKKLKKGFGWFVLLMGIFILIKEIS